MQEMTDIFIFSIDSHEKKQPSFFDDGSSSEGNALPSN